ncbi:MAG: AMP-dependent synthetase/ligase [Bdellovibrionota bacterium]
MPFILRPTLSETFLERVKATPDAVGYQYKTDGQWKQASFKQFYQECRILSFGLMGLGAKSGEKTVILSNSRYEWSLSDLAILGAGSVTVPIYASNTPEDVIYILNHCEAKIAFVEDAKQLQKILEKRLENPKILPHLQKIVVYESSAMALASAHQDASKDVITLQALRELGRREEAKTPTRFDENLMAAKPADLITICYTSGTTGVPKGVEVTQDNLMSVLEDCVAVLGKHIRPEHEVTVSFLPFSHILAKVESLANHTFGWRQAYAENLDKLMVNIGEVRPTLIFSVPRIFEKAYGRIHAMLDSGSPVKKKLFAWALEAGRRYYTPIWAGKNPGPREIMEYSVARTLVFNKVAQRFGGRLRFAVCGGAPLPREIGEFFQIVGIKILEGYGLTETCAPVAINTPDEPRFGTVGRPLPEVMVKIAEDGEILLKSRKVFRGYYKMPSETAEVLQDSWFHSGDIGYIDNQGFVHITDRKKDLIVTSGGKNVAPQKIENLARSQKLITQFVVHGDRRHYLTALVTLDKDQVILFANENHILFSEYSELVRHPKILSLVQKLIDDVNRQLASFETIKKFVILPNEFTVETGELTPSLKVRRNIVNKRFKTELDSMYA